MRGRRSTLDVVHGGLLILALGGVATYTARVVLLSGERVDGEAPLLGSTFVVLAAVAVVRALRAGRHPADVVFAVGLVSSSLGWLYWSLVLVPLTDPPYPSPADVLWMGLFPCAYVALTWHAGRAPATRRAFALDVLIAAAGVTAAVAGLLVPAVVALGGTVRVVGVNAVYLGANLAHVLLLVTVMALRRFRVPPGLWLRLVAATALTVTNSSFLVEVAATGTVPIGTLLNVGWLGAFSLMVLSVGTPTPAATVPAPRWAVLIMPLSGTALALVVLLAVDAGFDGPRWIAAAAVALVLGRMGLAFLEADALAGSHELAVTDELTGLVNRRGLYDALRAALDDGRPATVVLLDLNRFKEINDTLGHTAGDVLLTLVARRLTTASRAHRRGPQARGPDVVARIGGDEFALLLPRSLASEGVAAAERLLGAVATTYDLGGLAVRASAAAGVVHLPEHGDEPDEILRRADVAMYAAKGVGATVVVYHPDLDTRSRADLDRVERMREALVGGALVLHYQPKIDLRTGLTVGVEALARLRDHGGDLLLPAVFLSALAQGGQLRELTAQVVERAVAQAARWSADGAPLTVAINVPAAALVEPDFARRVQDALERHGLPGGLLYVEVTEETLLQDREAGRAALQAVRALGVRVSLDDYGTGWSSLSYLKDLPLDEIKLDRTFVRNMAADRRTVRIVESSVALAHGLDLVVVAEGVETEEDRDAVLAAGVDLGQGYLFARPMPAEEVLDHLSTRPGPDVVEAAQG